MQILYYYYYYYYYYTVIVNKAKSSMTTQKFWPWGQFGQYLLLCSVQHNHGVGLPNLSHFSRIILRGGLG